MKSIAWEDIRIKGELAVRTGLNFARLEGKWYRPHEVFQADQHGWPADWEGRIILALSLLTRSTHRTAAWLDEIVRRLPEHFNERGYMGRVLPQGQFDEQQMAGHSWLVRGLIEYDRLTGNPGVRLMIETIVSNLILPALGAYSQYPIDPDVDRYHQQVWVLSNLQTKGKSHAETSDAGCAFIPLDGVTAAYEYLGWPQLKELAHEMAVQFSRMDFARLHIQTHATLSACRGILRLHELTGERSYLDIVTRVFGLYKQEAWTEAYGNYNWFGLPRWTEPCAIIDSFLLSVNLWKATGEAAYLDDAHRIYFNALCHAQRGNGSFGTDCCAGAADSDEPYVLAPITYDVYWCCNMRGGEGLSRAVEYSFFTDGNSVCLPFYHNCAAGLRLDSGLLRLEERTGYPYDGVVTLEVLESTLEEAVTLRFFAPDWTEGARAAISINGSRVPAEYSKGFLTVRAVLRRGDCCSLDLGLSLRAEPTKGNNSVKDCHRFLYGPMLLGCSLSAADAARDVPLSADVPFERVGKSAFRVAGTDMILNCLCDTELPPAENTARQVLFHP